MSRDFISTKIAVLIGLGLLVAADIGLGGYSWKLASTPRTPQEQLQAQRNQLKLLAADVLRAEKIRNRMPATQKQCDEFEQSLFPASTGYSSVAAEMSSIAAKSGLHIAGVTFRQKQVPDRGLDEVAIDASIEGDYGSVVHFLNGLQRSRNLYAVDDLTLASQAQSQGAAGSLRVSLHVRAYFRAGA